MAPKKRPAAKIESQISISGGSYIKEKLKGTQQKSPKESIRIYGFFIELQSWDLKDLLPVWLLKKYSKSRYSFSVYQANLASRLQSWDLCYATLCIDSHPMERV